MDGARDKYREQERCIESFGGKTWVKYTTGNI